tara:strand:+ start:783 stop:1736 length:954 start_codon:yes stop_codon:yes gene_type:complete
MKKKILITGGSGYLGKNLAIFLKKKYNVFLGSRNNAKNDLVRRATDCEVFPLDVSNINSVVDAVNYVKPNLIIHAAATKFVDLSEKYPLECHDVNILGSANVARVAIDKKVEGVIGISTDKASPPIKNIYGMSKAIMEKLFVSLSNNHKTKFTCVRYGNVAWSTGSVLPIWSQMYKKNKTLITTGPYMRRFFFTVDDAVELVNASLKNLNFLNGKILSREMKASKMIDIIKVWKKVYGGNYVIKNERKGDREDEFLIGESELDYSEVIYLNKKKYFLINQTPSKSKSLKKIISSHNAKKLSEAEIKNILENRPEEYL